MARPIDIGPNNAFANRVNSINSQLLHKPINCTIKLNALIAAKVADEIEPQKICYGFCVAIGYFRWCENELIGIWLNFLSVKHNKHIIYQYIYIDWKSYISLKVIYILKGPNTSLLSTRGYFQNCPTLYLINFSFHWKRLQTSQV